MGAALKALAILVGAEEDRAARLEKRSRNRHELKQVDLLDDPRDGTAWTGLYSRKRD
jgi:hypothetical protein